MLSKKKKLLPAFLLFVIVQLITGNIKAQDNLTAIKSLFSNYQQTNLSEKIFVHTDKSFYTAGEIIWFKLYDVDAIFNKPLSLSKVSYVEILDAANKPVLQAKISLVNGEGNGSIFIPATFNSGNYKLRSYTNWMKNFGVNYFFEKNISIINTRKSAPVAAIDTAKKIDVQFFPEGGNLVAGLQSKLAFKVTDQFGKGVNCSGAILDNNDTLLKFETLHAGMGNFYFTPLSNHSYKAIISSVATQPTIKELPLIYPQGYVMGVKDADNNITVTINTNIVSADEVYLFVHSGVSLKIATQISLQNGSASFVFDKQKLTDGLSYITIFNKEKQPVCERLYFKKPGRELELEINTDKSVYTNRDKVVCDIKTKNAGATDSASLSMSVYRLDSLQSVDETTINNYLLLTSELKGIIEEPSYYFENTGKENAEALDNLMLTNGWRRFKWEAVLQNAKPSFSYAPEYNGHIVTGTVINTKTGTRQSDIETFLSVPGLRTQFYPSISNADGKIKFEVKDFLGSSEIVVQPNPQYGNIYRVEIDNPFSDSFSSGTLPQFQLSKQYANTLLDKSISMQVQNIYSANKLNQFISPFLDTAAFYLHPDAKYLLDDYTRFTTVEEVLREYVTFVDVIKNNGTYHFPVYDVVNGIHFTSDPLVLLDGVPVFDLNKFMKFDPLKLKKLEVITRRYILGSSTFSGILNWQTYKGDLANYELDPQALVVDYEGLQLQREFYSPAYDNDDQRAAHLPDFRNVLFWKPDIKIAANSSQQINFYTSDLEGKYAAIIQGLSSNGTCGSKIIFFDVKK